MDSGKSMATSLINSTSDLLNNRLINGGRLVAVTAFILFAGLLLILFNASDDISATHSMIRYTARLSAALFLVTFTASSLWTLWPNFLTRWLRANRRYFGLSFALSHFVHLGAIFTLAKLAPSLLDELTKPITWILGGFAYVLITMMAITSFDRTARMLSPKAWSTLHNIGAYYIFLVFANSFISRAVTTPAYILPAMAVIAALGLRMIAHFHVARRKSQD